MKRHLGIAVVLATVALAPACGDLWKFSHFGIDSVAYAPDGTLVVFTNGGIFLFDDEHIETPTTRIPLDGLPALTNPGGFKYSLSADGTVAAVSYSTADAPSATIVLYRVPTGEKLSTLSVPTAQHQWTNQVADLKLSPDGSLVGVVPARNNTTPLEVLDAATGATLWGAGEEQLMPVWSRDGATLFALESVTLALTGADLDAYDARTGLKWAQPLGLIPVWMAPMADGGTLATGTTEVECPNNICDFTYRFLSTTDGTPVGQPLSFPQFFVPSLGSRTSAFTCSATSDVCAVQVIDESGGPNAEWSVAMKLMIYRPDLTVISLVPPGGEVSSVALSPDGQFIATGRLSETDVVQVFRISDGARVGFHDFAADLL